VPASHAALRPVLAYGVSRAQTLCVKSMHELAWRKMQKTCMSSICGLVYHEMCVMCRGVGSVL